MFKNAYKIKVLFISVILSDVVTNFSSYVFLEDVISTSYVPELKYSILIIQTYEQDLLQCSINLLHTALNSNTVLS
jgi:hypothetical protein